MGYETIKQAFEEMFEIEASMYDSYDMLIGAIKNKKIKLILERIRDDEKKHESNVSEILKILKD
ncbi:MAG: hypothetical protein GXP63_02825 [DPANN group archaeon]|nr:hypothetical protein [DPANN group archaeon]